MPYSSNQDRAITPIRRLNTVQSIHLQYYGKAEAKRADQFKIGESFKWNGGATSAIVAILKETAAFITFQTRSESGLFERRLKKDRLVAIG